MNGVFYNYPYIYYPFSCNYTSFDYWEIRSYSYYYILLNNEFKFDHNIIGLEFNASEAGSFFFELGTISCDSICSGILENYGGSEIRFYSYYSKAINFVNGRNIIYFENRVNAKRESFVQINFLSGKLLSIAGTRKATIQYYRHPCKYYSFDGSKIYFAFMLKTITEKDYYKGF
ncbi:unnamed protein product, partial [Brachionus calyciflorus]